MILTIAILATLAIAVHQDLTRHRIPNALTLGAAALGIGLHALAFGTQGALHALAGAGVGILCFLPLYAVNGMGAGDVKLMGAAGATIGPSAALIAALLSLAVGALLAIAILVWRALEHRVVPVAAGAATHPDLGTRLSQARTERFPYAAAIAAGVILAMWLRGLLNPVLGNLA